MRLHLALVGALAAPSLVGCAVSAPPDPGPETTSPSSTPATAVVEVDRTTGPGESARTDAVVARVVRVKQGAVDESALRIAGIPDELPAGGCIVPSEASALNPGQSVELLNVGPVSMASDGARNTLLMPRTMPDPAGVVSGFFYSARSADAFAAGSRVTFKTSGGTDLPDGFTISANAPKDLTAVRAVFGDDGALDVAWDATEADPHDVVYADVLSPAPHVVLRCVASDTGHLVVPASHLNSVDEGQLAVHRLHRESFRAKGIDPGEVRFDVAKVITFRR
ncbi:MAG: hypothetical protein KIT84_27865 [Labilithrix sp.]|nr:hypothetical protein [Labilithrix sp.]MCW5814877.1 hypothetical protein [Labilithrix sp.]